ncbi:MAG: imidazole glycerol phosphate synthase subunit HisH [Bacteroidetes bacterium]|nr:imidazole glycerol phosphate synthase subunit HisH [Bacteroidota bacterium]
MITIIDYGIGNLRSIEKAFQHVEAEVLRTDRAEDLARASHLVLPGVGAFGACIDEVRRRRPEQPILDAVDRGVPFLGVCVGMQLLFDVGEERGQHQGLGILPGRVVRFERVHAREAAATCTDEAGDVDIVAETQSLKVPHMGWNNVVPRRKAPLLAGIEPGAYFYFVHSYHAVPATPDDVLATTTYGVDFPAIVARNNVFGVQFHPEKSQHNGLRILKNFAQL